MELFYIKQWQNEIFKITLNEEIISVSVIELKCFESGFEI